MMRLLTTCKHKSLVILTVLNLGICGCTKDVVTPEYITSFCLESKELKYDSNDILQSYSIVSRDEKDRILKFYSYDTLDNLLSYSSYTYNKFVTTWEIYQASGELVSYWEYEDDSKGNRIRITHFDADGEVIISQWMTPEQHFWSYEYDNLGRKEKMIQYNHDSTVLKTVHYQYGSNGKVEKEITNKDKINGYIALLEYDNYEHLISKEIYVGERLDSIERWEYSENDKLILHSLEYIENKDIGFTFRYEYDKSGVIKKEIHYRSDGSIVKYTVYQCLASNDV